MDTAPSYNVLSTPSIGWCNVTLGDATFPCSYVMNPVLEIADMLECWLDGDATGAWEFDAEGHWYDITLENGDMNVSETSTAPVTPTAELFEQTAWLSVRDRDAKVIGTVMADEDGMRRLAEGMLMDFARDMPRWFEWEYVDVDEPDDGLLDEYRQMYVDALTPVIDGFKGRGVTLDGADEAMEKLNDMTFEKYKEWALENSNMSTAENNS